MLPLIFGFAIISCVVSNPAGKSIEDIRIVGGEDVDIKEVPYQVSLMRAGRHACGGAIVTSNIIVTAAHCVMGSYPELFKVRVGSSFSGKDGQLYPVGEIIWHPGFNFYEMDSDIAIVWLSTPLIFNDKVAPIEMADEGEEIADGNLTLVTGWGHIMENGDYPTMLQRVRVPKINEETCNEYYQFIYTITSQMLCAGTPQGGRDACQGDSGGPLVYNNKLFGVVSWGLGCARPDHPGVYAKVSALRSWLDHNIAMLRLKNVLRI